MHGKLSSGQYLNVSFLVSLNLFSSTGFMYACVRYIIAAHAFLERGHIKADERPKF